MSNFGDCILVKLVPSEPDFVALSTFDIFHGKSSRFFLRRTDLLALLDSDKPLLDTDIGSYIQATLYQSKVHFKLTWLRQDFRNDVTGYIHSFDLPVEKLRKVLNGQRVHHVEYITDEKSKAKLVLTDSSHYQIGKICQDKLTRHALRRFFRDHFNYGSDERLLIYPDIWVKGFFFQCDRLNGGIVRHEDVVTGKDGREYKKVFYALHT